MGFGRLSHGNIVAVQGDELTDHNGGDFLTQFSTLIWTSPEEDVIDEA